MWPMRLRTRAFNCFKELSSITTKHLNVVLRHRRLGSNNTRGLP